MKKCSHWVMQGRLKAIKANSGAQVICREEGGWGEPLQGASWESREQGTGSCPVPLLFWTLLFWGWNRGNVGLLCADLKDEVVKLLSLEATQDHAIVELGQSTAG